MIFFTDIDDTLMKTSRKVKDVSKAFPGAMGYNGEVISFMDKGRKKLVDTLLKEQTCIPVTARNQKSFDNLLIKFNQQAILNFGATIINHDRSLDLQWYNSIALKSEALQQEQVFFALQEDLKAFLHKNEFEAKISFDHGIYNYMNFRHCQMNPNEILSMKKHVIFLLKSYKQTNNFYLYNTDRDLAVIPCFIKKEYAVSYLLEHHYPSKELSIGIGDHANDLSFMSCCDFAMLPTDSTLMKLIQKITKD